MELAKRAGIDAAPVRLTRAGGRYALLVERFDRGSALDRRRVVSALTVLGLTTVPGRSVRHLQRSGPSDPRPVRARQRHAARAVRADLVQHPVWEHRRPRPQPRRVRRRSRVSNSRPPTTSARKRAQGRRRIRRWPTHPTAAGTPASNHSSQPPTCTTSTRPTRADRDPSSGHDPRATGTTSATTPEPTADPARVRVPPPAVRRRRAVLRRLPLIADRRLSGIARPRRSPLAPARTLRSGRADWLPRRTGVDAAGLLQPTAVRRARSTGSPTGTAARHAQQPRHPSLPSHPNPRAATCGVRYRRLIHGRQNRPRAPLFSGALGGYQTS